MAVEFEVTSVYYSGNIFNSVESVTITASTISIKAEDLEDVDEYVTHALNLYEMDKRICHLGSKSSFYFKLYEENYKQFLEAFHLPDIFPENSKQFTEQCIIIESRSITQTEQKKIGELMQGINMEELSYRDFNRLVEDIVPHIETILHYPHCQSGAVTIHFADYECLSCNEYLNDVIIDFYLQFLYEEVISSDDKQKTYICSSFFYNALTKWHLGDQQMNTAQKQYEHVKNWTKDINIFEKRFVIVPVNESEHWFLAIICLPSNVARSEHEQQNENNNNSNSSCILIFDSLGMKHESVIKNLRGYLNSEYEAKMGAEGVFNNMPGQHVAVPHQTNTSDCGLFVLQYVEYFFLHPIEDFSLPIEGLENWFAPKIAMKKRNDIADLIKRLMVTYESDISTDELPKITRFKFSMH